MILVPQRSASGGAVAASRRGAPRSRSIGPTTPRTPPVAARICSGRDRREARSKSSPRCAMAGDRSGTPADETGGVEIPTRSACADASARTRHARQVADSLACEMSASLAAHITSASSAGRAAIPRDLDRKDVGSARNAIGCRQVDEVLPRRRRNARREELGQGYLRSVPR